MINKSRVDEIVMNWSKSGLLTFGLLAMLSMSAAAQTGEFRVIESKAPQAVPEKRISEIAENSKAADAGRGQYDPEYEDTEFGEFLYNEASVPTRIEILSLLSKETPSMLVFMHAISMGLGIDDVLDAAIQYEPSKGRDFAQSAIALLPLLSESPDYFYTKYRLEDLYGDDEKDDEQPYTIKAVADRFFEDREILVPYADWTEGQFHFAASASELLSYESSSAQKLHWYYDDTQDISSARPIFVSMYEADQTVLIDNQERVRLAIKRDGKDAKVPVVVIYNRLNERSVDQLSMDDEEYPLTLRDVQKAYSEDTIMVTPAPEWEESEYHIKAKMEEIYDIFDIPVEQDFEPEHWQRLLNLARRYGSTSPSFLVVVLPSSDDQELIMGSRDITSQSQFAYNDPRAEEAFPYVSPNNQRDREPGDETYEYKNDPLNLDAILAEGLVLNRPDLIAALNAIGIEEARIAFYYIDPARTKPFINGPGALRALAIGAGTPPGNFGGDGGFGPPPEPPLCASPPCTN